MVLSFEFYVLSSINVFMRLNGLFKKQANLSTNTLIIAGILAVLNFLSYQIFATWDLTQNKDYSISEVSKRTARELDDIVNIKAYFSGNLPARYINLPQEVKDIVDSYQKFSKGKIRLEFIDPKDDQELISELQIKGIPQLQFNVLEKDKYQVVNGYLGMSIQYGDKIEVIPVIQSTADLEYEITSKLKKLTAEEPAVIGYVTSHGTLDSSNEIKRATAALSSLYEMEPVDLTAAEDVPDKIKTLIIAGPKEEFKGEERAVLDKFLMKGGSLMFLLDGVKVENNLQAAANATGLDPLLESYGLKLNRDLVLDPSSGIASFNQGFITFNINYPFWPKILNDGFDKDNAAVARLETVILPWVSSVDVIKDKIDPENLVSYLVKSSQKSSVMTDQFNLNPQQDFSSGNLNQYNLAVAVFGKFKSAIGNGETANGRIVLVGDSDFLRDNMQTQNDNAVFFQNLVDSLTLDGNLISIRSKGISSRPLKELEEANKAALRYGNVFGLTALVIAFGLWRYYARRRSRLVDEI